MAHIYHSPRIIEQCAPTSGEAPEIERMSIITTKEDKLPKTNEVKADIRWRLIIFTKWHHEHQRWRPGGRDHADVNISGCASASADEYRNQATARLADFASCFALAAFTAPVVSGTMNTRIYKSYFRWRLIATPMTRLNRECNCSRLRHFLTTFKAAAMSAQIYGRFFSMKCREYRDWRFRHYDKNIAASLYICIRWFLFRRHFQACHLMPAASVLLRLMSHIADILRAASRIDTPRFRLRRVGIARPPARKCDRPSVRLLFR